MLEAASYEAEQIQVLDGLEPVRKRPGMYIGSTGSKGLHHLVYEVLDNAIDEVQAGHAKRVDVSLDLGSKWVTIGDDGRGIPTGIHPRTGKSALETVMTILHAGGKFGGEGTSGYKVSGGLHGVGISVVNALSSSLEVKVWRGDKEFSQSFSRGAALGLMSERDQETEGTTTTSRRGTQVKFQYDESIFSPTASFDSEVIRSRLRELAFLNSGSFIRFQALKNGVVLPHGQHSEVKVKEAQDGTRSTKMKNKSTSPPVTGEDLKELSDASWQVFHFEGGIKEYVLWMNEGKEALHEPIFLNKSSEGIEVQVSMQWCSDSFSDTILGYANSIRTVDGGTHLDGMKAAVTRAVNTLAKKQKLNKEGEVNLNGDHIREGLSAICSVKVPDPEFEGQTKTRLGNPEVRKIVETSTFEALTEWFEQHPQAFASVIAKASQAARAADAAKKARELVRRKNVLTRSTLPGKLADCTSSNREETEIFLVEGDSAGGSAKQARDRRTQAVLPLRGKILNVERKDDASLLKNNEIANLIVALGLGTKGDILAQSLRYNRVILLTDADVDGAHIRTLLLTFLFRYRRDLFEQGHVFVAVPPLFKVELNSAGLAALAVKTSEEGKEDGSALPVRSTKSKGGKGKGTAKSPNEESSSSSSSPGNIRWCYSDIELREMTRALPLGSYTLQRFKGLGEMMPEQLWSTTLNPMTRQLRKLTIDDAAAASHMFTLLMGDKVGPRRELIETEGARFSIMNENIDI